LIKRLLASATRSPAFSAFVSLLERIESQRPNLLRILTYHRVDEPDARPNLSPALNSAAPHDFDQQMRYLSENYHVVSMPELVDAYHSRTHLPPRSVMVTVDDAYTDFAEHIWPTMKRYRLPITLFVPTGFPDHPERTFWWDRLQQAVRNTRQTQLVTPMGQLALTTPGECSRAFKQLRGYVKTLPHSEAMAWVDQVATELGTPQGEHHVMSWHKLRQLAAEGVTLGAHTQTHPMMNRISLEEMRTEAVGSRRDLEREIGPVLPIFAYPSGGFNDAVVRVLKDEGFVFAFTTVRGLNDMQTADPLRLRRINVGRLAPLSILRAQLLSATRYFNRWQPLSGTS
jgi:peptidoglycan/xylan/chitin deacetylase (PgdA/CDA1 family)